MLYDLGFSDFLNSFLRHVHTLLKNQELMAGTTHWVKTDAAKASNMKQSETMRSERFYRL